MLPDNVVENPLNGHTEIIDKLFLQKREVALLDPDHPLSVAIFTHSFPDPDAIGSAMGIHWALEKFYGLTSTIFYDGAVSHPQNHTIVNLLDPSLLPIAAYQPEHFVMTILLDTVPKNAGIGGLNIDFDLVIDHHKESPGPSFEGEFLHMKTGSCAAIVYRLLEALGRLKGIWFDDSIDLDRKTATGLICGIVTDTEFLMSEDTTEHEFAAFMGLAEYRSHQWLKDIIFYKKPKLWVTTIANATSKVNVDGDGFAIVGLGAISETQRDLIAAMADEMAKWASVEMAIAFAIVDGKRVEGSVRSSNASISVSELCKKLATKHGNGGGKLGKGAYWYGLGGMEFDLDEDKETVEEAVCLLDKKETRRIQRIIKS